MSNPVRRWKDSKDNTSITNGKWTESEIRHLRRLLCKYAARKKLNPDQLASLCSDTTPPGFENLWTKLAKFFPNRSVQSVHNSCKRYLNPCNYKGEWSLKEERTLVDYVQANGHKWKDLAEQLERTATNVKDKWKQMGGDRYPLRKTGAWTIEETVELVRLVFLGLGLQFDDQVLVGSEDCVMQMLLGIIEKQQKNINKKKEIPWEAIAEMFKTRSSVDCRTRWSYIVNFKVPQNMTFSAGDDLRIFKDIKKQNARSVDEIDFSRIRNGKSEADNKFRFKVLAKAMSGRLTLSLNEILVKLEYSYDVTHQESTYESLLDYYTANFPSKKEELQD